MTEDRWAIYIDIEGFSTLYSESTNALWALNKLMLAVHRIGKLVFAEPPDRLFAHQIGDGFLIISDFCESKLDRAASIAIVLMKYITQFGLFARASIAEGELSDITGCYPTEVLDFRKGDTAKMGSGLMTIFPVMGTALINAVSVNKRAPKGPLLVFPSSYRERISATVPSRAIKDTKIMAIDWIHAEGELINEIQSKANLELQSSENLEILLINYISKYKLPSEWKSSCLRYMGINA